MTALATGLGALPFLFNRNPSHRWVGLGNAVASGLMIAASLSLVREGAPFGPVRVLVGAIAGVVLVELGRRLLAHGHLPRLASVDGLGARRALLLVGVMTLHSAAEGVGVGVSFAGGETLGLFITAAIAAHNVPEGLAISLVLVPHGSSVPRAAGWSVFSSFPQPLLALPAYLFVTTFQAYLPIGLGLAAGAMLWLVVTDLLPEAFDDASGTAVTVATLLAALGMAALQMFFRS